MQIHSAAGRLAIGPSALIFLLGVTLLAGDRASAEETHDGSDVAELLAQANQGKVEAQLELAEHFLSVPIAEEVDDPKRDFPLLEKWLQAASAKGSAEAARLLGGLYFDGVPGVAANKEKAFNFFKRAAEAGDIKAALILSALYRQGVGVPANAAEGERWLRSIHAKIDVEHPLFLQVSQALEALEESKVAAAPASPPVPKAADQPDAEALFQRGVACGLGQGVERDLEQAAQYLMAAAAQGHPGALRKLDVFDFYPGLARPEALKRITSPEGLAELTVAAERGEPEAQFALGLHRQITDHAVKAAWLAKAAAQRHRAAMGWLSRMYENGEGVPRDRGQAHAWDAQAALLGDRGAMIKLGQNYFWGYTGTKDAALAKYWYLRASAGAPADDSTTQIAASALTQLPGAPAAEERALGLVRQAAKLAALPGAQSATPVAVAAAASPVTRTPVELLAAAEKGDADAMYQLGCADLERRQEESNRGSGVVTANPQRNATDFRWIMAAARAGHPGAQFLAATHWLSAETDAAKKTWLEKAAAQNHAGAKEKLAAIAQEAKKAVAQAAADAKQALADRELAAQGDADAAYRLFRARMKEIVATVLADFSAAQNGQPTSGKNYRVGYLDAELIKWGDTITNNLHPDGLLMLHDYLRDERPDFAYRALLLRERIAKTDLRLQLPDGGFSTNSRTGFAKALAHLRGKLTADQRAQTEKSLADQFGGPWVDNVIGANFERGVCGYPQDHGLALVHYRRAAEAGLAGAQYNVGRLYEYGRGVAKDLDQAGDWYDKAAAQGHAKAAQQGAVLRKSKGMDRIKALSAEERAKLTEEEWAAAEAKLLTPEAHTKLIGQDATVQTTVGIYYRDGVSGFVKDYARAAHWFERAAKNGAAEAETELGNLFYNGWGRPVDRAAAFQHYLRAAERGHALGQLNVGYCLLQGEGVPRDPLGAHDWLEKAAAQGQPNAQALLSNIRQDPGLQLLLAQRNEQQALQGAKQGVVAALSNSPAPAPAYDPIKDNPILRQGALATKALQGDQAALAELNAQQQTLKTQRDLINGPAPTAVPAQPTSSGDLQRLYVEATYAFVNGKTIDGRKSNGLDLWEKAANLGHADSALRLAAIYRTGERGAERSLEKSRDWLRKAAATGDESAADQLSEFEREMTGGRWEFALGQEAFEDEEPAKAIALFEKSAALGHTDAMLRLGRMYREGFGAKRDEVKARAWFQKAADAKSTEGMLHLAYCFRDGVGGAPDLALARQWFEQAAAAENDPETVRLAREGLVSIEGHTADSAITLGLSAFAGKDYAKAMEWFKKGSERGSAIASYYVADMYANGEGVRAAPAEALRWFEKAATQGHKAAKSRAIELRLELKLPPNPELGDSPKSIEEAILSNIETPTTPPAPPPPALTPAQQALREKAMAATATGQDWLNLGLALCPPPAKNPKREGLKEAFPWFLKAAEAGVEPAQFFLILAYRDGFPGSPPNEAACARWMEKLAGPAGPRPVRLQFAQALESGLIGVRRDRDHAGQIYAKLAEEKFAPGAQEWERFQRETAVNPAPAPAGETAASRLAAARAGNVDAAVRHYLGNGYELSEDAATETALGKTLAAGAAAGSLSARAVMAWSWIENRIGDEQVPEQIAQLRAAAEAGVNEARYRYGLCLWDGVESIDEPGKMLLATDRTAAVKWFTDAAMRGHPLAHEAMGRAYAHGIGVDRNEAMGRRHFRAAAALGVARAHVQVAQSALREVDALRARIIGQGRVPHADEQPWIDGLTDEAVRYFESGVKAGDADAMVAYARILDASMDRPRALGLLQSAAKTGSASAYRELAGAYASGDRYGLKRDIVKSRENLVQLVTLGDSGAAQRIGDLYLGNEDHPRDPVLAYQNYALAVDLGANAGRERDAAAKMLSAGDRAKADQTLGQLRGMLQAKGVRLVNPRPASAPKN